MNPNRSTDEFSPLAYLNWIQRGSTEDWKRLYPKNGSCVAFGRVAAPVIDAIVPSKPRTGTLSHWPRPAKVL